jgi:hypothetical protein
MHHLWLSNVYETGSNQFAHHLRFLISARREMSLEHECIFCKQADGYPIACNPNGSRFHYKGHADA